MVLRRLVSEQQAVRDVIDAPRRQILLPQARCPSETVQDRPDQIILGLALVRPLPVGTVEDLSQSVLDTVEGSISEGLPLIEFDDRFPEKIAREQSAVERCHDPTERPRRASGAPRVDMNR